jgi:hypothetical protein
MGNLFLWQELIALNIKQLKVQASGREPLPYERREREERLSS